MIDDDMQARLDGAMEAGARASGIPLEPFTEVEKREAEAYGEAIAAVSALEICGVLDEDGSFHPLAAYDTHNLVHPVTGERMPQGTQIVEMLAAERFKQYEEDCRLEQERLLDTRQAPSYDETDPLTATRLYVLVYRNNYAVALETPYDWKGYLREAIGNQTRCDVHLLHRCYDHQATRAVRTLVYKRGEYVFAWKMCLECLDALSWVRYGHPDYAGPLHKWVDEGQRRPMPEF